MNSLIGFLIFLPAFLRCASVVWDPVVSLPVLSADSDYRSFPCPEKELTYLFWKVTNTHESYSYIYFQSLFKNGNYTDSKILGRIERTSYENYMMSVKISQDRNHILVTYPTFVRYSPYRIYLTESINGGKNWTKPEPVFTDEQFDVTYSLIALDEDSGQVYIVYIFKESIKVLVRAPGKKEFKLKGQIALENLVATSLAYTIDKARSKRYLHIFWKERYSDSINYIRSEDDGVTWTPSKELVECGTAQSTLLVASDTNAAEAGLFVQYYAEPDIKIHVSKDHGTNWSVIRAGSDFSEYSSLCVCGYKGKGKLFSMNGRVKLGNGFIRYQSIYERFFFNAGYPFKTLASIQETKINCWYDGKGNYTVSALVQSNEDKTVYLASGTITEI